MIKLRKKSVFFPVFRWTFPIWRIIVCALFAQIFFLTAVEPVAKKEVHKAERRSAVELEKEFAAYKREAERKLAVLKMEVDLLKQENAVIRKELLETLDKFSMQAEKLKRYEMSAAAVVESMNPVYIGNREEESAGSLRTVMQSSAALASSSASLCDEVLFLLRNSLLDPVLSAKLRLRIDSLKNEIRRIAILNVPPLPPDGFASCRVLNLDEKLNAVVLSAGYRQGVRAGMLLRSADGKVVMQVVALKNFTCAALVTKGNIASVGIGMEAFATGNVGR